MTQLLSHAASTGAAARPTPLAGSPFSLDDDVAYQRWRAAKLAARPTGLDELVVDIGQPRALKAHERAALLDRLSRCNLVVYRGPTQADSAAVVVALASQLGLAQLDGNWLADEDGVSHITPVPDHDSAQAEGVADRGGAGGAPSVGASGGHGGFIPYTRRAIRWHTDGYYHPSARRIRSMLLHCVRPAADGGDTALLDPELAYIALRDEDPGMVLALMADDAMTIPARLAGDGEALPLPAESAGVERPAQSGPVFSVDARDGRLHMRYTARSRSIVWRADQATQRAVARLQSLLDDPAASAVGRPWRLKMAAGMGVVTHNVLHDRSAFDDSPEQPRLLYRARYLDLSHAPELPWRIG